MTFPSWDGAKCRSRMPQLFGDVPNGTKLGKPSPYLKVPGGHDS